MYKIASTGLMTSVGPSIPRGWLTRSSPPAVSGQRATATVPTTTTTPTNHAKYRQRGEGGRPSGKSNPKNKKRPMCGTHDQEETQASASPPGSLPGTDPGSASNVTIAYSALKRRTAPTKPIVQKIQPIGFWGGKWGAITAPTTEKLIPISIDSSQ
jgi:hypothetical protein